MLLDQSYSSLFLENLGATIENLLSMANLIIYNPSSLTFENFINFLTVVNIWPSQTQFLEAMDFVLFSYYWHNDYLKTLKEVYYALPYFYALDYLHLFYLKQIVYKCYLSTYSQGSLALLKPVVVNLHFEIFLTSLLNKWSYAIVLFGMVYFLTNIMFFRFQYGFNFYFNYFKTLADLGEQEFGAYDDYKFFLFLLVQILTWYCWVFFIGYTFFLQSESKLVLMTLSVMITILTIPVRLLWDFGLAFGMYVRGAASSSNLVVEAFFDIIGVVIIFTRFIVQNIRFLMVFVAFFELFEWTFSSTDTTYVVKFSWDMCSSIDFHTAIESNKLYFFIIAWLKFALVYFYHLLHLIIVSFMQIGVYLMVSFWLFFFLYTSFFKLATDSYFSVKRSVNVC